MAGVDPTAAAVLLAKRIVEEAQQRGVAHDRDHAESMRTSVGAQVYCSCCVLDPAQSFARRLSLSRFTMPVHGLCSWAAHWSSAAASGPPSRPGNRSQGFVAEPHECLSHGLGL